MNFAEAEAALSRFQSRGWRLGLDRMRHFLAELGLDGYAWGPERPRYLHVAGTNGKGSVTRMLQGLLEAAGERAGACYSPYVHSVRERVQIGLDLISEEEFARLTPLLLAAGERTEAAGLGGPTMFELKTALGFLAWRDAGCTAIALETGLGGRLDATNVVDPAVSVITSISLDHTQHLGSALAEIAREKAGIIKPGRPVIAGSLPAEAIAEVESAAKASGSPLWRLGREGIAEAGKDGWSLSWPGGSLEAARPALPGDWQGGNAALALAAMAAAGLALEPDAARRALAEAWLPGRLERRRFGSVPVVLEGAHNEESARLAADWLAGEPGWSGGWTLVFSGLQGHDTPAVCRALAARARSIHLCPLDDPRALSREELESASSGAERPWTWHDSAAEAIRAAAEDGPVLAAGSYVLVCEAGRATSVEPESQSP